MSPTEPTPRAWWQSPKVVLEPGAHQGQPVIFVRFGFDADLARHIRELVGARWSQTQKSWYVADNEGHRAKFGLPPQPTAVAGKAALGHIHAANLPALERLVGTLQLRAYRPNTIRTYRNEFAQLLALLKGVPVDTLDAGRLRSYFLYCTNELKLSENTLHSRINAVKFYFEQVLGREKSFFDIPRPQRPLPLPNILAMSQVERLFAQLENLKHKTMLFLAYSAGLRVSEVVNLKTKDIHPERMVINIRGAKGKKDRSVGLSEGILELLGKYCTAYQPQEWLFEGQYANSPYSPRSLQQIFHRAKQAAKIRQDVTYHSLRHSYATHLHQAGTDTKIIQGLLGHNDLKTTPRYTHASKVALEKVQSPFDKLKLGPK
jgi:integrase/recombinase XerD